MAVDFLKKVSHNDMIIESFGRGILIRGRLKVPFGPKSKHDKMLPHFSYTKLKPFWLSFGKTVSYCFLFSPNNAGNLDHIYQNRFSLFNELVKLGHSKKEKSLMDWPMFD